VTGEGRKDAQSLHCKAPLGVVAAARAAGVPVLAVAGRCDLAPDQLAAAGVAACFPLADLEPDPARSMADAAALLRTIARTRIAPFLRRGL
ncbi:MAG: glycerate kinase, partial [Mycobacteriaceae bacterium]|nr:glycerate kinase [Mycobacteriaceae bacterium]